MQAVIRPGTILVVDDQESNVDVFRRWLEVDGHTVHTAGSGNDALEIAEARRPDLVLLDIMIPSPSGFEVCERLKKDPATRHIPVVLISGLQDPSNWKRGRALGAVDFLRKPLKGHDLRTKVREHLERSRQT